MKKLVYISGIASMLLMLIGSLCKIMHWPGAGIAMVLSVVLFCLLFLPTALIQSYNEQQKHKALHVTAFIVFFVSMLGVLFKVMHWPGAGFLLLIGVPLPFVLFLPVYLYSTRERSSTEVSEKKHSNLNFLGIMFGLTFLAVFSVLLALNPSRQILERTASDIAEHNQSLAFIYDKKQLSDSDVNITATDLCRFIDDLNCEMINFGGAKICTSGNYDPHAIENKDQKEIPSYVLIGRDDHPGKLSELKSKINAFRDAVLKSSESSAELKELSKELFSTEDIRYTDENGEQAEMRWEDRELSTYRLIFVLDLLSEIKSNVRLVEREFGKSKKV